MSMSAEERKKRAHNYYLRNREKLLKKHKEYYQRPGVREKVIEYQHNYYKINKETIRKRSKEYRQRPEVIVHQKTPEAKERRREIKRRYRQRHREKVLEYDHQRYRTKTDYWKKWYLANREEIRAKQRQHAAKPESKAKKSAYTREYQAKPEVHERDLAKSRAWKKTPKGRRNAVYYNERRRARMSSVPGSFTKEEWLKVRDATGGVCPFCGRNVGLEKMSMDHIIPLSKGGTNYISNIRAICRNCNSAIGNRPYMYQTNEKTGKRERIYC